MNNVKKQYVSEVYQDIAVTRKKAFQEYGARYNTMATSEIYAQTSHVLKLNPTSVLVELKKTIKKIEKKSKAVDLEELLYDLCNQSAMQMGRPTHLFPIGTNRYALVVAEDIVLFTKADYTQSLVCMNSNRNFQIYAPNLKVGRL
jgi:hypothetical protein